MKNIVFAAEYFYFYFINFFGMVRSAFVATKEQVC